MAWMDRIRNLYSRFLPKYASEKLFANFSKNSLDDARICLTHRLQGYSAIRSFEGAHIKGHVFVNRQRYKIQQPLLKLYQKFQHKRLATLMLFLFLSITSFCSKTLYVGHIRLLMHTKGNKNQSILS